ncbi:MAG TPA: MFS transporter [Bacteroidota bacterium]|nr:MFS transporter [Bacteroidota bacterium]
MKFKVVPVFLAFLAMGFLDAVGPFVGLAKNEFTLSNTVAFLIPFMGYIMFGLLSVPMGITQAKKGKKFILLLGLAVMFLGLLIPIFGLTSFALFLLTVLLLGAGATIMQVAGNPIMRDVSDEGKYSRNLSLAQFVKAIGSLSGPVIPAVAAMVFGADWKILFPVFAFVVLLTMLSMAPMKVEERKYGSDAPVTLRSCLGLLKNGYVAMMVGAIFLYVGSEVCMSSGIPLYLSSQFGIDVARLGLLGTGVFFTSLMIGRLLGGVILSWVSPKKFFVITVAISCLAILGLYVGTVPVVVGSVILVGFGFANIFPLVFSIAVDAMPEKTNELSGLMITAIVGGAIVPPIMGFVADRTSVSAGFLVPLLALLYVGWVAVRNVARGGAQNGA